MIIDLRSDTFSRPGEKMLQAMHSAPVGDDVFGEDPTVNKLERMAADLFGMENALFCPSGTMTNQIAIKAHTLPGDEIICSDLAHVYIYEGGGIASNSLCQARPLPGHFGRITAQQVADAINPEDIHRAPTTLVCLENTANRGGGSCYDWDEMVNIRKVCDNHQLKLHLDGARLFNAIVAKGETPEQYGKLFHSISICLSKGLGCPVGSLLLGTNEFIKKARRIRKVFGGGMRQAGYLAAAGIYTLENNIQRLQEDHDHVQMLAAALAAKDFTGEIMPAETNILIFEVKGRYTAALLAARLKQDNIHCMAISPTQIRMVTHIDVTREMINKTIEVINAL